MKKLISVIICFAMLFSAASFSVISEAAVEETSVKRGAIINCFGWSYSSIYSDVDYFKSLSFGAIQIPPIQPTENPTKGLTFADYAEFYKTTDFSVDSSGNGAQGPVSDLEYLLRHFEIMATAPEVILEVDVIGPRSTYDSESDYCSALIAFLKQCIDMGIGGFCFVNADQAELSDANSFWATVCDAAQDYSAEVNGRKLFCYATVSDDTTDISALSNAMSVTDGYGQNVLKDVVIAQYPAAYVLEYTRSELPEEKLVVSVETVADYVARGSSASQSDTDKAWALTASRSGTTSVYFPRPEGVDTAVGSMYFIGWRESAASSGSSTIYTIEWANNYGKYFRYCADKTYSYNNFCILQSSDAGMIVVNFSGNNSVSVPTQGMKDANYREQVTANTFSCVGTYLYGTISASGVGIVFNQDGDFYCEHESHSKEGICDFCKVSVGHEYVNYICTVCGASEPISERYKAVYFDNSFTNWETVCIHAWREGYNITGDWPGAQLSHVEGDIYKYVLPYETQNMMFNNGNNGYKTSEIYNFERCTVYRCVGEPYTTDSWTYDFEIVGERHDFSLKLVEEAYLASAADCTNNAKYYTVCADCGKLGDESFEAENTAAGHTDENGDFICDTCQKPLYSIGDINRDNTVNSFDYLLVKRSVLGAYSLDSLQKQLADISGDGKVRVNDYILLKRTVLNTYSR